MASRVAVRHPAAPKTTSSTAATSATDDEGLGQLDHDRQDHCDQESQAPGVGEPEPQEEPRAAPNASRSPPTPIASVPALAVATRLVGAAIADR